MRTITATPTRTNGPQHDELSCFIGRAGGFPGCSVHLELTGIKAINGRSARVEFTVEDIFAMVEKGIGDSKTMHRLIERLNYRIGQIHSSKLLGCQHD